MGRANLRRVLSTSAALGVAAISWSQAPVIAAGALLHPWRRVVTVPMPEHCRMAVVQGDHVQLTGWHCDATGDRRGTIVYLHGIADNRGSAAGVIRTFQRRGFDVLAFDSRAHGDSGGAACTYGFYEKHDLRQIVDTAPAGPVILVGTSLGAAIALQEAPTDPRISGVVAGEVFADLRTVATERAPWWLPRVTVNSAFAEAEREAQFVVADVSPVRSAARIRVPVLLVHGAADVDTPAAHSRRVFQALAGPRELILVPGARHNESMARLWPVIEQWVDSVVQRSVSCVPPTGATVECSTGV